MQLDFMLTLQNVLVLFLLIIIGFIAGKTNVVSEKGQSDLTNLVLNITMPATIFKAMQLDFNIERIQKASTIIIITICCYVFLFVMGIIVTKRLNVVQAKKDVMRTGILLSNTSFMGYPIVANILGEEALFYAVLGTGFIFEMVSWSIGQYLISRNAPSSTGAKFSWKKVLLSPGVLAIIIGLIFFVFQIPVIEPFESVINTLSPATSPLAMIVVGLMLSRGDIKEAFKNKYVYLVSAFKLIINPLIILFVLKLLGFTGMEQVIPTIMLAMPSASFVAMFAGQHDNNPVFASQIVFITTLLSVVTIPLITLLF